MQARGEGGGSYAAHAEQAAKTLRKHGVDPSKVLPDEKETAPPIGTEYLWGIFCELCSSRSCGFGPNPIGFVDIKAWCELNAVTLSPFEVSVLRSLDLICLEEFNARSGGTKPGH
jgi:hypothetical protein